MAAEVYSNGRDSCLPDLEGATPDTAAQQGPATPTPFIKDGHPNSSGSSRDKACGPAGPRPFRVGWSLREGQGTRVPESHSIVARARRAPNASLDVHSTCGAADEWNQTGRRTVDGEMHAELAVNRASF